MSPFYKLSGSGNDFIALVEPASTPSSATLRQWCRRGISIGADGVFTLTSLGHGRSGERAQVRIAYFNCDGEPADLCLNATRCAAQLTRHLGWSMGPVTVHTAVGSLRAEVLDDTRVAVEAPQASTPATHRTIETALGSIAGWSITVGVPHFVHIVEGSIADVDVAALAPSLRSHPRFGAAGTNVDFVRFAGPGAIEIRSFERGIEAETLACGTGVLAAAAVGVALAKVRLPLKARTAAGFELEVDGEMEGSTISRWTLTGDARLVAEGRLLAGSAIDEAC